MPHAAVSPLAPGARVVVRDTEWLVRRVDKASTGGKALTCVGLSELVRDKEAVFLTDLEARRKPVQVLDPATTKLVPDVSNEYQDSLLYLESLLRQTPPTDANIFTILTRPSFPSTPSSRTTSSRCIWKRLPGTSSL